MDNERESRYSIEALARGLNILELFTYDSPSLSLTEIAATLNLSKSTVFRILSTLQTSGYLDRDLETRSYRPSLKVLRLGFTAINSLEVRQVARPYLEALAKEVDETVSLCVLDGTRVVYVDRIRNHAIVGVVLNIGSHVPAHCTTMGKILISDLLPDKLDTFLKNANFKKFTSRTITDREIFLTELSKIRRNGYALSDGELAIGLRAAGAPIFNNTERVVAAMNVSGSTSTISLQRLKKEIVPAVMKTAHQISLALGYRPDKAKRGNTL